MIRDVELMIGCFWFLWEFIGFIYFLDCRPKILGDITWSPQKETSMSKSKISLYFLPFSENESVRLYDVSLPANSWSTRTLHVLRNWRRLPFAWFQGIDTGKICSKECSFPLLIILQTCMYYVVRWYRHTTRSITGSQLCADFSVLWKFRTPARWRMNLRFTEQ
jgi:hypothetical protein